MKAKARREVGDLVGAAVWCVGKLIERRPRCPRRDTGVPREQMLVKVIGACADHCDVHALGAFGS